METVAGVVQQGGVPDGPAVLQLLDRQVSLYRRLRNLAGEQHKLVSTEEASKLLSVLGERQQVVDELAALDKELKPLRRDWPMIRNRLTGRQRDRANQMVAEVGRLLREIIDSDRRDGALLTTQRNRKQQEMAVVGAGERANAAYGQFRSGAARYLDETDEAT